MRSEPGECRRLNHGHAPQVRGSINIGILLFHALPARRFFHLGHSDPGPVSEAHELWSEKHGEKIQRREKLKWQLEATSDPGQRQKIGKILEATRKEIEPLPRISKYAALFKSENQQDQFFRWAKSRGWEEKPQCSLWLTEWRKAQWARREYRIISRIDEATLDRLEPDYLDVADSIALADSGAVVCTDNETESAINDAIDDYFESPTFFEQNRSWGLEASF